MQSHNSNEPPETARISFTKVFKRDKRLAAESPVAAENIPRSSLTDIFSSQPVSSGLSSRFSSSASLIQQNQVFNKFGLIKYIVNSGPENEPLGLTLSHSTNKPVITSVDSNSRAELSGLKPGDLIYEINGNATNGVSAKQVVDWIKSRSNTVEFLVSRDGEIKIPGNPEGTVHEAEPAQQVPEIRVNSERDTDVELDRGRNKEPHPRLISLRANKQVLDFSVVNNSAGKMRTYRIYDVTKNSEAEMAGLLNGDYILDVSGKSCMLLDYEEVTDWLRIQRVEGTLEMQVADPYTLYKLHACGYRNDLPLDMNVPRLCRFDLVDPNQELGFNLVQVKLRKYEFKIANVSLNSVARLNGLVDGDYLIEISGKNILNWTNREIVSFIKEKKSENDLQILVTGRDTWSIIVRSLTMLESGLSKSLDNLRDIEPLKAGLSDMNEVLRRSASRINVLEIENKSLESKLNDLKKKLKMKSECAVCMEILSEHTLITPCGHMFCKDW
jgi:C-terminal processing protease CtpA/Prc